MTSKTPSPRSSPSSVTGSVASSAGRTWPSRTASAVSGIPKVLSKAGAAQHVRQRERPGRAERELARALDHEAGVGDRRTGVARHVAAAGQARPDAPVVELVLHG